jgi:hypothetical protein
MKRAGNVANVYMDGCRNQFLVRSYSDVLGVKDNIKMDLREQECECMNWIYLANDMDRWQTHAGGNEHSGSLKCGEFLTS